MTDKDPKTEDLSSIWEEAIKKRQIARLEVSSPERVTLPSGLPVMAVRSPLIVFLEAGRIPDGVTPFVLDLMELGDEGDADAIQETVEERWEEWKMMLDSVWLAAVVKPRFTRGNNKKRGFIPLDLVPISDKISLFNWCQGVTDHLASFRVEALGDARSLVDESGLSEVHSGGAPSGDEDPGGGPLVGVAGESGDDGVGTVRRQPTRRTGPERSPAKTKRKTDRHGAQVHVPTGPGSRA
jgi:hypothetical protein